MDQEYNSSDLISAEGANVLLNPLQSFNLVPQTKVAPANGISWKIFIHCTHSGSSRKCGCIRQSFLTCRQESEVPKPVRNSDENDASTDLSIDNRQYYNS